MIFYREIIAQNADIQLSAKRTIYSKGIQKYAYGEDLHFQIRTTKMDP
jgi:hypothetical protein